MKTTPADFDKEPSRQRFGKVPRFTYSVRWGNWWLQPGGLFRWTRYDFVAGGKPTVRYDWRRIRGPVDFLQTVQNR